MTMTQRDAQALTYLAGRLRDETKGASKWDEHGTYAVVSKLIGQNLATSVEQVIRHAGDAEAKTPGAINRPFLPPRVAPTSSNPTPETACRRCGGFKGNCACTHEHRADEPNPEETAMNPTHLTGAAMVRAAIRGPS